MNQIDLNNPPPKHNYKVSIEREETGEERKVRLFKDVALFSATLVFVGLIIYLCYSTLVSTTSTADEKKWAMSVISGAAGGMIGYLVRK